MFPGPKQILIRTSPLQIPDCKSQDESERILLQETGPRSNSNCKRNNSANYPMQYDFHFKSTEEYLSPELSTRNFL